MTEKQIAESWMLKRKDYKPDRVVAHSISQILDAYGLDFTEAALDVAYGVIFSGGSRVPNDPCWLV